MDEVQSDTLKYFLDFRTNSLLGKRTLPRRQKFIGIMINMLCIYNGGFWFWLATILVGVERGFIKEGNGKIRIILWIFLQKPDRFHRLVTSLD